MTLTDHQLRFSSHGVDTHTATTRATLSRAEIVAMAESSQRAQFVLRHRISITLRPDVGERMVAAFAQDEVALESARQAWRTVVNTVADEIEEVLYRLPEGERRVADFKFSEGNEFNAKGGA